MIIETSILAAFGAMLFWGIGDFLIQRSVRKIGDLEALAYIGIIGSIVLLPFVWKEFHLIFVGSNLALVIVLGVLTFIVGLLNFEALKRGKLSVVDVILELELPVTAVLGFIMFNETPSLIQLIMMSLIFIGIVLIALKKKTLTNPIKKLEKGVFIAALAAVGMGLVNFLTGASAKQISPLLAIWVPWVIFSILCLIVIVEREGMSKFVKNGIRFKKLVFAMALFDTLAWLFYAFAVHKQELSITTAITESYVAIALFLGFWLNKEKIHFHQFLGALLAIISSIILAIT